MFGNMSVVIAAAFAIAAAGCGGSGSSATHSVSPTHVTNQSWWNKTGNQQTLTLFQDWNTLSSVYTGTDPNGPAQEVASVQSDIASATLPPSDVGGYYKAMLADLTASINDGNAAHYNWDNKTPNAPQNMLNAFTAAGQAWNNLVRETGMNPAPAFPSEV